jgi:hypothetical protein
MKTFILVAALALAAAACGGVSGCTTTNCPAPSIKTYSVCHNSATMDTDAYGGRTCSIDTADPSDPISQSCQAAVSTYCGS